MIQWSNTLPQPGEFAGIRLLRVPPKQSYQGLVTSTLLQGCPTHYAERRTQPCTGETCRHCLAGLVPRFLVYLSICSTRTRAHAVLELTALAAQPVNDYQTRHGSIRGALLTAERAGNRPNSPVRVTICPDDSDHRLLPPEVDLRRFFALLWHLDEEPANADIDSPPGPSIRNTIHNDPPTQAPHHTNNNGNGRILP